MSKCTNLDIDKAMKMKKKDYVNLLILGVVASAIALGLVFFANNDLDNGIEKEQNKQSSLQCELSMG